MPTRLKLVTVDGISRWYKRESGELHVQCAYQPVDREFDFCAPPPDIPLIEVECGVEESPREGVSSEPSWVDSSDNVGGGEGSSSSSRSSSYSSSFSESDGSSGSVDYSVSSSDSGSILSSEYGSSQDASQYSSDDGSITISSTLSSSTSTSAST